MFVQKLSVIAKIDLDVKISKFHFFYLIEEMIHTETPAAEEDQPATSVFNPELYT